MFLPRNQPFSPFYPLLENCSRILRLFESAEYRYVNRGRIRASKKILVCQVCFVFIFTSDIVFNHFWYTGCPNKNKTRWNMPVSLKFDKYLNHFGYYLLEGYLLFPTVPRNVGSVMSVNEHEHFKDTLTIWRCTKMLRLRQRPYTKTWKRKKAEGGRRRGN